ncbi:T9SS type A sorting domain-containing protein [Flavobacterium wongokense]|uniref:T9SS type A sorting domain-containing protein n=1 Tax=Flavobacterium wongokense TaxID=2910674 RepID=UPI001F4714C8|nr:T9SS type A sorting domain-containing protein [Flavobacterium sp. WG47]MCF6133527.1 T9SS type A sorting domain-containing protein [Flavobacterium sp. WG47]
MKKQLLYSFAFLFFAFGINAQTISLVGSCTPENDWGADYDMVTSDNISYTLYNFPLTTATDAATTGLKFRQDHDWTVNWGNANWPSGTATQGGANIMCVAGTYDITFNRTNGTYTFIPSTFTRVGIWGPAVDSQNGFAGPDVDMVTTDGIHYTLSGFYFSSGTAYFRYNDDSFTTFGSVSFPTGNAVEHGPSIQVTGGEWFVTYNKDTGAYSFAYPSIGILGTATSVGWGEDIDLSTNDGFEYIINNLPLTDGVAKFRKDNLWDQNWGSLGFPSATGIQNGPDIPVTAGTYNIVFQKASGHYLFTNTLSNPEHSISKIKIYPNPTTTVWNLSHTTNIDSVELFDVSGKVIGEFSPNSTQFQLDATTLSKGVYFVKIKSGLDFTVQKIIRN